VENSAASARVVRLVRKWISTSSTRAGSGRLQDLPRRGGDHCWAMVQTVWIWTLVSPLSGRRCRYRCGSGLLSVADGFMASWQPPSPTPPPRPAVMRRRRCGVGASRRLRTSAMTGRVGDPAATRRLRRRDAPTTAAAAGCGPTGTSCRRPWRPALTSPTRKTRGPRGSTTDLPAPYGRGWSPSKSGRVQSTGTSQQHHRMLDRPGPAATTRWPLLNKQH
jgi:hypothetical protein